MKLALAVISILCLCGCLNKIPAVAKYQASATEKCQLSYIEACIKNSGWAINVDTGETFPIGLEDCKKDAVEACRVLPYPSTEPTFEGQVATAETR